MNGFIGALAAQLAPQLVLPAADGIASRPRNAFPSAWRWRYVDVMRSRVSDDGDILPRRIQKRPRTGKGPLRGNVSPPCIQNELALARYACHVSEKPCKSPWRIHRAKILPGRGPFRCTNPSNHARRADLATIQRSQGLANGSQEELGIASALRIAADGPTTMIAYVCGSRARSWQLPLCGRWRKPMTVSAAASEQCSGAYARPVLRHPPAQ